jgi:GDP-L-fucose synthase
MKRILITGGGGLVGNALVKLLKTQNQSSEIISINSRKQCDLTLSNDVDALFKFVRPTHVFHLAASVYGVGGNLAFPGDVFYKNTMINASVIEACRKYSVQKIVAMGSAAMYSDSVNQPMREQDVMSDEPHSSEYSYAYSKRGMLVQLESYNKQFNLDFAFVVATNMYGPHDRFDTQYGHVVPSLLRKFLDAEKNHSQVEVWGDGSPTRDFLFADDAAIGLHSIMTNGSGVYNLASGCVHSISDLVRCISQEFPKVPFNWNKDKPMGQLSRSYDINRIKNIGFNPTYSLTEGIKITSLWLRRQDDLLLPLT